MPESPLVSVLMTAYNREKYIAEAIESVLASSYKNFELIIVDDRSNDRTVEIARSYQAADNRVQVYINDNNLGDYPNRNRAASYAKGEYLKYVDADDHIYPWGLQLLVQMMEQFPEAGWGLCSIRQNDGKPFPFILTPSEAYAYHYLGQGLFHKAPLSAIIKRNVFNEVNGFAAIRMAGDFELWHRLAQRYPVLLMPEGIVWYRKHGEQEMNTYSNYAHVYNRITMQYIQNGCPLDLAERERVLKNKKSELYRRLIRSVASFHFKNAVETAKTLRTKTIGSTLN